MMIQLRPENLARLRAMQESGDPGIRELIRLCCPLPDPVKRNQLLMALRASKSKWANSQKRAAREIAALLHNLPGKDGTTPGYSNLQDQLAFDIYLAGGRKIVGEHRLRQIFAAADRRKKIAASRT